MIVKRSNPYHESFESPNDSLYAVIDGWLFDQYYHSPVDIEYNDILFEYNIKYVSDNSFDIPDELVSFILMSRKV